jgi:fructokinase
MRPGLSSEEALHELVAQGPGLVVITRGAQGVIAATTGGANAQMPTFAVEVADTVGAGDAFCAGLLAQLAEREMTTSAPLARITSDELSEILRFAAAVAALNCTQSGANPPRRAAVEQFLRTTCPRLTSE